MRKLYTFLLFILFVAFADAQHITYPDARDLKGNARSMKQVVFVAVEKNGKVTKGDELSKVQYLFGTKKNLLERDLYDGDGEIQERYATNFDENGNLVEETEFNSDSLQGKYTYRYDNKGNMIGWMSYTVVDTEMARGSFAYDDKGRVVLDSLFDAKGKLAQWDDYTYDDQNHVTKETHSLTKGDKTVDNYVYDMDGYRIQDTKTGLDGETKSICKYKYNSEGKLTESDILTDSSSDYMPLEKCKYDVKGNKTEDVKYHSGAIESKEAFKYDIAGNVTEDSRYRKDGSLDVKFTYKYDDAKNKTEYAVYKSDTALFEKWTYKYDPQGNKIEEDFYKAADADLDNIAMKFTLEYDKNGNWIRETGFQDNAPITLAEREIVYY